MKGIYVLTCEVNGKEYVGIDSRLPSRAHLHLRGKSRCPAISAAIGKHGADNFTVEIIRYPNVPHQILCWFERSHIAERNTKAPNGYNLTDGGDGGLNPSDETRRKRSASNRKNHARHWKDKAFSKQHRENISKSQRGKKRTPEQRKAQSERMKGENHPRPFLGRKHTAETKEKIAASKRGKPRSPETIEKLRAAKTGAKNHNFGKPRSPEVREKIAASNRKTKQRQKQERRKASGQGTLF